MFGDTTQILWMRAYLTSNVPDDLTRGWATGPISGRGRSGLDTNIYVGPIHYRGPIIIRLL